MKAASRTGYSYLRYSSPQQSNGDSIRRQDTGADAWCKRNGVRLDPNKRMIDRGFSASDGSHIRCGALGQFLAEVAAGGIDEGSVLIIDNLDRLSRLNPWDAIAVLCSLVNAGITVVTLSPAEMVYGRGSDLSALMMALIEFGRSHSESQTKKVNLRKAWGEKKRQAREEGRILTSKAGQVSHYPHWLEPIGGKLVPIPERVAAIRQAFEMAAAGHGVKLICKALTAAGCKAWGHSGRWVKSYVYQLLKSRSVLGEYQPHRMTDGTVRDRKRRIPDGEPIAGYYPAVIEEGLFNRVQAALVGRLVGSRPQGGRVAKRPDLFTGLLRDAGHNCKMLIGLRNSGKPGRRKKIKALMPSEAIEGRGPMQTFPYRIFETAIRAKLREAPTAEVLGAEPIGEAARLAGELAAKEMRYSVLEAELAGDGGDVRALAAAAKTVDHQIRVIKRKLTEARARESNPRAEALEQIKNLDGAAEDQPTRLRLRSLLQTVIESIHVLIVRRRALWLVAVQVNFAGGGWRNYLIDYRPAGNGRKERWDVDAFKLSGAALLDLRRRRDVAEMRRFLETVHDGIEQLAPRPEL